MSVEFSDAEIKVILSTTEVSPEMLVGVMNMAGLEATGDAIADVKALAEATGLPMETMLYGFIAEDSPFFADVVRDLEAEADESIDEYEDEL